MAFSFKTAKTCISFLKHKIGCDSISEYFNQKHYIENSEMNYNRNVTTLTFNFQKALFL